MSAAISQPEAAEPTAAVKKSSGTGLGRYVLIRFLLIIPTIFILTTLVFFLMRITGDPITAALGGRLTQDQLAERVAAAGYDRPILVQYFEYMGNLLRGDFGTTISDGRPVTEILLTYGAATVELVFYALIVAFIIGIPLGMLAAYKRDKAPDAALRILAILGYATPVFFAGMILKLIFGVYFPILPVAGRGTTETEYIMSGVVGPTGFYIIDALRIGNFEVLGDVLAHAVLPALALGILTAGVFLRLVRTNLIGTLGQQYIDSGRSRGISEFRLVTKHAYRPALIPIVTVMGMQIALMLAGAVLTETTFEWKGIGFKLAEYLTARDFVAVQGIVVMLAVIVAFTNFIVDVIAAFIDPRVRY
ncbi:MULTISPECIES: ABC transporter permease [Brevibacterium]|uniref:Dipeptide/oligopeptide/nickel ABC transporter permease n=3 Tax=Bacteria TaxID=2 RepID=K9AHA9_9MICO|nr:ABC transporter permease [Brevibacterium casei]NJE67864.1 ABC transporter permease [Brevibacterium sp. LS14]EKU46708.1 dipeptide/oligopeptide/nickel ABC transporter permease [Brevibacterium casei S18]KZE21676.1 peptide ABC transporter permease [Brevibacterium casei]MBE4694390.1 ABC transporter permease [Brevibacterium casei]MBY3577512.1 ABC transporter permease [Brevibacterium casei]